jgi:hypothetical protein
MIPIPIDPRLRKSPITDHLPMNTQNQYVREIKEREIFGSLTAGKHRPVTHKLCICHDT